ncbi:hypothetical protein ACSS6W_001929 [Trichoderma asperelloides]
MPILHTAVAASACLLAPLCTPYQDTVSVFYLAAFFLEKKPYHIKDNACWSQGEPALCGHRAVKERGELRLLNSRYLASL